MGDQLGVLGGGLDSGFASLRERPTPRAERYEVGRRLREEVPRWSLADWSAPDGRPDPVDRISASHIGRVPWLVPVRVGRMVASPYAFLRGTAGIMAADFAALPATGITPVVCGDAHLGNFGFYASPERELVFDLNDFDEAHPGAWEWDLRRLVTSVWVAGRQNGSSEDKCADAVARCVSAYRHQLRYLAYQPLLTSSGRAPARRCAWRSSGRRSGRAGGPATGRCRGSPSSATAAAGSCRSRR